MTDEEALDILNEVCTHGIGCRVIECRTMEAVKRAVLALAEKVAREA